MEAQMNYVQQVKNAWGDIRFKLQLIEAGIEVPMNRAKQVADLREREKMAAAILGL